MSLEIYKRIEIENKLNELLNSGKSKEESAVCLVENSDPEYINYIIEACLMPIDEITSEIERYDSSYPKLDEIKFVSDLSKKYNVDKKAIIERIQNVRKINKQDSFDTPKRLERLKNKRDLLEREKKRIFNSEQMNIEEKSMYYLGLGIVTLLGGVLFYPLSPVLVGIIPVGYAVGLPTVRNALIMKKEHEIIDELVDLGKEIEYLEKILSEKEKQEELKEISPIRYSSQVTSKKEMEYSTNSLDESKKVEGPTLVKRL